jgi:hypothetical protein
MRKMMNNLDNELFDGQESYAAPKPKEVVINKSTGKIVDDMKPIHLILASALQSNIRIKVPEFKPDGTYDTGCRRKECMGRGYTGFRDEMPILCSCLFYHEDLMNPERNKFKLNRKNIRKHVSMQNSLAKEGKREQAAAMGLKQIDSDIWVNSNKKKFKSRWNEAKKKWVFDNI